MSLKVGGGSRQQRRARGSEINKKELKERWVGEREGETRRRGVKPRLYLLPRARAEDAHCDPGPSSGLSKPYFYYPFPSLFLT